MSADNGVGTPAYIKGVPHPLPPGETLLWEGAPATGPVATHVFHWRFLAIYFVAVLIWWAVSTSAAFGSNEFVVGFSMAFAFSLLVLGIAFALAKLVAGTSWYAITNRRVVLRVGMVFPMSINIPFTILESAGVGMFKDGTGQVLLTLVKGQRIAYIALWPHCRVFKFAEPQPVLRGLVQPKQVADILARAVNEFATAQGETVQRSAVRDVGHETLTVPQTAGA
jgi:Bacterial PH domain